MHRRPSPLLRATRALTGLVTMWCLGCSAYEPLLDSLLGASVVMECDSEVAMRGTADVPSSVRPSSADRGRSSISAIADDSPGFDCGCGTCHAPSPDLLISAAPQAPVPTVAHFEPSQPASLSRAPLLPPPEFAA